MAIRELFDFIVDPCIADDDVDSYLEKVWFVLFSLKYQISWLLLVNM